MKNRLLKNDRSIRCDILLSTISTKSHNFAYCFRIFTQNSLDKSWNSLETLRIFLLKLGISNSYFINATSNDACCSSWLSSLKCVDSPLLIIIMKMSKKFHTKVELMFIKFIQIASQSGTCSANVIKCGTLCFASSVIGSCSLWHFKTKWSTEPSAIKCSTETIKNTIKFLQISNETIERAT